MLYKRCDCADPSKCPHAFWYAFELHGRRFRGTTKTANLRLADKIATKQKTLVIERKEGLAPVKPVRLTTHIVNYVAHTKQTNKTAYKDEKVLARLVAVVGDRYLSEIKPFDLERFKTSRAEKVERSTVNRELNIVRGCFSRAVDWGHIATSPAVLVDNYRVDDTRIRVLSDDELRTMLNLDDEFVVLLCRATLESLSRISALLGLKREHIGPTWMEMLQKGGAVGRVPITQELRTALLARCHESGSVFGEGALGRVPTQQTASNRVLRAMADAGLSGASHHTCRHTGVTLMLEAGVNPRTIQKLAGWSSLRMLERYGHARDAEAIRAVTSVASYLEDNRVPSKSATSTPDAISVSQNHAANSNTA